MKKDKKVKRFELRTTTKGRSEISRLAKRLKVSEGEAIRRAVTLMLLAVTTKA